MTGTRILVVEDEGIEALDVQQRLRRLGYIADDIAFTGEEAVRLAEESHPDLVLMDIMLRGEMNGILAAGKIRSLLDIPVVYLTAYSDEDTLARAKRSEPYGYLVKPFDERELRVTIDVALYKHEMECRLRESERWLATALRSIGDAVITTDKDGLVTFVNPVAEQAMGCRLDDVRGRRLTEALNIVNMYTRKPVENPVSRVLAEGVTVGLANHTILIARDGREIPIDDSAAPIKDEKGNVIGVILVFRDVGERAKAEQTLRESEERYRVAAEQLADANRRKNDFMAILSHELRNPLASIWNGLSIIDHAEPCSDQANRAIGLIKRQIELLSRLVNDLLDIARIEQNKVHLHKQPVELGSLVRQVVEDHRQLFERSGVSLKSVLPPSPVRLCADKTRLAQVIGNLLQNAAKFTGTGGSVDVCVESDLEDGRAVIRVSDTGIGMSPELLARVFQPFVQADNRPDRSHGGLGLGLALSKGLVELHGGTVSVCSAGVGRGSEFVVSLPMETVATQAPTTPTTGPSGDKRRVLVLDDNVDLAESLCELLELKGHSVAAAFSGPDAIAKAKQFRPDVLLCDIGLPHMDGYEVARAFRKDSELKDIFLVALTGYTYAEDLKRTAEAGFDRHVAKPVDLSTVERVLAEIPDHRT